MQPAVSLIAGAVLSALLCSSAIAAETSANADSLTERARAHPHRAGRRPSSGRRSDRRAEGVAVGQNGEKRDPADRRRHGDSGSPPRVTTPKAQAVTSRASTLCR